jgi:hypothetical protein
MPMVQVRDGLVTVWARGETLQRVVSAISRETGIELVLSEGLRSRPVSIERTALRLETVLRVLLVEAGIAGYRWVHHADVAAAGGGHWATEPIRTVLGSGSGSAGPAADAPLAGPEDFAPGEVLVKFAPEMSAEDVAHEVARLGVEVLRSLPKVGLYRLKLPAGQTVDGFLQAQQNNPAFERAEPNPIARVQVDPNQPNDPLLPQQWALTRIGVPAAWAVTTGRPEVVIAVIDTGVDLTHADLQTQLVPGLNVLNPRNPPQDDHGHGTAMAGIVSAAMNNGFGIVGVCPGCRIMPIKALDADGVGTYADVIEGILYAADHDARVLNLSVGGTVYSVGLRDAVDYARTAGAVVVAAAGNSGSDAPVYPAAYTGVLAVAAVDRDGARWAGSNHGPYVSLAAPGVDITTTGLDGDFVSVTGTSPATAHVAGVAALTASAQPDATGSQIEEALRRSAEDVGDEGTDEWSGYGVVRADQAASTGVTTIVDVAVGRVAVTPGSFETGDTVSITVTLTNLGTDTVATPTVTVTANGRLVATEAGPGTVAPGASAIVTLSWVVDVPPGVGELVLEAEASPTPGETDLANNRRHVRSAYDPAANVYVLYKERPFVHSWVALQAYNILPAGPLKTELFGYLYGGTSDNALFGAGKVWQDQYTVPSSWGTGSTGTALLEGAMEEDTESDTIAKAHFWDPDLGYEVGMTFCQSNLARAQEQFQMAVHAYNDNDKATAYYRLGRVAHLLGDMGVPEHAHRDPHLDGWSYLTPNDFSSYEDYTKLYYRGYTGSGSPKSVSSLPLAFPTYSDRPSSYDPDLARLFYNQAEYTQHFDSSDMDGNGVGYGGASIAFPGLVAQGGSANQSHDAIFNPGYGNCTPASARLPIDSYNKSAGIDPETTPTIKWQKLGWTGYSDHMELFEGPAVNATYYVDLARGQGQVALSNALYAAMGATDRITISFTYRGAQCSDSVVDLTNAFPPYNSVPDKNLKPQADVLVPENIRYVSGLLQLFWEKTHQTQNQTLSVSVTGNGSVTSSPAGISCSGSCSASYPEATLVTLTASAGSGAAFTGWGGDCWGTSSCAVTMGSAHNVTATFTGSGSTSYTLSVSKTGSGTVTSSPSGISCGSTCLKSYASGTVVTLTASAGSGYTFSGWGGDCGAAGTCTLTMSTNRSVTAAFTQNTSPPPGNTGSLIVAPNGIDVYWRQNNRIYHVTDKASVVDVMQGAGMPGWVWSSRTQVGSLAPYAVGPEFIEGNSRSEGLLIRQVGHDEVYWINNGVRRWVACPAALAYRGTFPDVIEVPAAIIASKVSSTGGDFSADCPCTGFSIWPDEPPSNPSSSAGSQTVQITGTPWTCAGTWSAAGDGQWLSVNLAGGSLTGTNTEDWVTVSWTKNTSPSSRSSHATIANHAFPVTQQGAPPPTCSSFEISPTYKSTGSSAGNQSVTITGYPSGCQGKSWTASNGSWVTVSPSSGSGPRSVTASWTQNTSWSAREESVSIAGRTFTVSQGPANRPPVANAGPDQIVAVNALVTLSGSGSSDPDSGPSPVSYAWSQVSGPTATLSGASTVSAAFTAASAGTYVFELRVSDGSAQATDQVTVTAAQGVASYDATLKVPKCGSVGSVCDSGSLLVGRAGLGPEPHQPNTINTSCADGTAGTFHSDESSDRIRISTLDGTSFAGGKTVQVETTVWAWSDPSTDSLEIYQAADASSPSWTLVATLSPAVAGAQTLAATYTLPAGSLQAVRARFRWAGSAGSCGPGGASSYDDHDDLVFAVGAATTQGWISGKVKDTATGLPLTGVQVSTYDSAGTYAGYGLSNSSGFYTAPTGPTSGTYYARTSLGGDYVDELYDDIACPGGTCSVTRGTPIGVTAGGTTSAVDFGLALGGRISGTVRNATTGAPLANIGVYIFPPTGGYVAYDYTDSSGVYTVTGLPTGTYYARSWDWGDSVDELYDNVPCPGWSCGLSGGTTISVTAGTTKTGIDFGLVAGGRIGGTVTSAATGLPLVNVRVSAYRSDGSYVTDAYSDSSGAYTIAGLPPAAYYARTSNSLGYLDEVYDNVACAGGSCSVTSGTSINVTAGSTAPASFGLAQGGRISGTVTDAATGLPLANTSIQIYSSSGSYVTYASTSGTGSYTTLGLPAGTYRARTSNPSGYVDELYDDIACPNGSCIVTSGAAISVTAGSTTSGISFALAAGGRISGTVTDAGTGLPLAAVYVDVHDSSGSYVTYGYTNGSGAYTAVDGLPSGTYYAVTVNSLGYVDELYNDFPCAGGTCSVTSGAPISVTGGTTTGIDFALVRGGQIGGTVTDASTGLPLASIQVRIYNSSGIYLMSRYTNSSGAYTIPSLPAAPYYARTSNSVGYVDEQYDNFPCPGGTCTATSGSSIGVTTGSTTAGIDFALGRGGRISGTVTDASTGLPLANVRVAINTSSGTYVTYGYTNSSGVYTSYTGLVAGTYYARTSNAAGYLDELYDGISCPGGGCLVAGGSLISVAAGSTTTGIDFGLAPGGRISGTVTDAASGLPLADVDVDVYTSDGSYVTYGYTDTSGVYTTASGLPSGTYRARTWTGASGYVDEAYNAVSCPGGSCSATSGALINVTAPSTRPGINFALERGGQISGVVTDAVTGRPLASVSLATVGVRIYDSSGGWLGNASTNGSGRYTSPGLPPGVYHVRTSNAQGYVDELHDDLPCAGGLCTVTSGTPVTVAAGATTGGINFGLAPGGRITGTLTDAATASPLVGAQVRVYDSSGRNLASATTTAAGAYTTSIGLPSGTYFARTNAPGYVDELYDNLPCPGGSCTPTSGAAIGVTAGSTTGAVDFALVQAPPQTNDEIAGATPVSGLPYGTTEDTRTATTNPSDPVHTCATGTQDSNSVWFRYVATFTGTLRADTFTSNYDTVLTAYAGTTSVGPELACNDDTNGQQSEIRFEVSSGETYLIEVSDYSTPNGGTLMLTVAPAPPSVTTGFATGIGPYGATLTGGVNPSGTSTATAFEYGTTTGYGSTAAAPVVAGSTTQGISALISGLACATTYHFRAFGTNAGGTASGADVTFPTAACPAPTLSVDDATVAEGNAGTTMATFTVTLSRASSQAVTVSYSTADGTATAGSDYITTFGPLTIPAGSLSGTVSITVNGDRDYEPQETFSLDLSNPTNATLADGQGVGTITNDDPAPTLSIGDVTVRRPASGTTSGVLPVTLSAASYQTVTVAYATSDGTATAGTDYATTAGNVTFLPGVTTGTVDVAVNGSSVPESRAFFVDLASPTNAGIGDGRGEVSLIPEGQGFYTVAPCRAIDTRSLPPGAPLTAGVSRTFPIAGNCGVPLTARAVSLNLTVTGGTRTGNVKLYPGDTPVPTTSSLNFTAGLTRANNAISLLGTNGDLAALLTPAGTAHVIIDVNGYFE